MTHFASTLRGDPILHPSLSWTQIIGGRDRWGDWTGKKKTVRLTVDPQWLEPELESKPTREAVAGHRRPRRGTTGSPRRTRGPRMTTTTTKRGRPRGQHGRIELGAHQIELGAFRIYDARPARSGLTRRGGRRLAGRRFACGCWREEVFGSMTFVRGRPKQTNASSI